MKNQIQALLIIYIISRQIMRQGVLPLNSFISFLYLVISGVILILLKKAVKPHLRLTKASKKQLQIATQTAIDYDKLIIVSWLKKYTLIGSCFNKDKKFLLKEFLFLSVYAVTCLNVNHMIIWPLGLSAVILPVSFLFLQLCVFKFEQREVDKKSTTKLKATNQRVQSEIELEAVNIENQKIQSKTQEQAKFDQKKARSLFEILVTVSFSFASILMIIKTVFTLGDSLSNSGQLNILSVLSILAIDQLTLRPLSGGLVWVTYKITTYVTEIKPQDFQLVYYLCSQEVTSLLVESEKIRLKRLAEITASPPKKKYSSPSKVPKALIFSADAPTYLNLISLQPTKRRNQDQQNDQIQNIYLTTAERQLFEESNSIENKSGVQTRRKKLKENGFYSLSAAQKGATKEVNQNHDLVLIKDEPLHQIENNQIEEFCLEEQNGITKRKNGFKKKNKRNLKLTGSSPYLEYLPDMLKKVDKYKHEHPKKQAIDSKKSQKIL